jgi:hypothetical protein
MHVDQEKQRKNCLNNMFLTQKLTIIANRKGHKTGKRKEINEMVLYI